MQVFAVEISASISGGYQSTPLRAFFIHKKDLQKQYLTVDMAMAMAVDATPALRHTNVVTLFPLLQWLLRWVGCCVRPIPCCCSITLLSNPLLSLSCSGPPWSTVPDKGPTSGCLFPIWDCGVVLCCPPGGYNGEVGCKGLEQPCLFPLIEVEMSSAIFHIRS